MRLDDFSGHTKGVNLCKDHISHRWDLKLQWNMNVEKRFMDHGSFSLHLSSIQKWRTAVVLSSALLSLQEKSPHCFRRCIRLFSFYNSHRLWKWWALRPICLQNDERCMRWRGVAEVGAPIVFQVKENPVYAWFFGQRLKWKTFSARGLLRNRMPSQKN